MFFLLACDTEPILLGPDGTSPDTRVDTSATDDTGDTDSSPPTGPWGNGADGALLVEGTVDLSSYTSADRSSPDAVAYRAATIDGTTVTLSESPQGLAAGDEVLILDLQGPDGGVGAYTFATLVSVTATLTLTEPVIGFDTEHVVIVTRVPNYTDVTISADGVLTTAPWNGRGGGVLAFRASNSVTVDGQITVAGLGYRGGDTGDTYNYDGYQGESWSGLGAGGNTGGYNEATGEWAANDGGGGAHITGGGGEHAGGATAGDAWLDGATPPQAGEVYGSAELSTLFLGSGGGGVWNDGSFGAGPGGAGGGIIYAASPTITIQGRVSAAGEAAVSWSTGAYTYGAGGGAGGVAWLRAEEMVAAEGAIDARGGLGQSSYIRWGGDGGDGRVRLDCGTINAVACGEGAGGGVALPEVGHWGSPG